MSKQIIKAYTFNKTAQTVTFTDFSSNLRRDRILLITDVTNGTIIYQFNNVLLGGTVSSNVLTPTFNTNTTAYNNSDALQIFYDSSLTDPLYDMPQVTLGSLIAGEDLTNNVQGALMKPVVGSQYAPGTYVMPASPVTKANIKAAAGNVYAVRFTNNNPDPRYFQLFNSTSAPAGAATAQLSFLVDGATDRPGLLILGAEFFAPSEDFANGISFGISTTNNTFTDSATATDHTLLVRYVNGYSVIY
jgi:hypothetical protein